NLSLLVFLIELVSLAKDGDDGVAVFVVVLAGERVEHGRSQLEDGGMEGEDQLFGERGQFRQGRRRGVGRNGVMSEQPSGQFRLVVGAGPAIVPVALVKPEADMASS